MGQAKKAYQQQRWREQREGSTMEEQVWISHIQDIALADDWVTVTDLMGRTYRLDPQVALELAVWIAEHYQDVAQAGLQLQLERRLEEARVYGPLLGHAQPSPKEDAGPSSQPASPPSLPKRRRRSARKKEDRTDE
jgi:hypothetical protein